MVTALLDEDDLLSRLGEQGTRHGACRARAHHHHVGVDLEIALVMAALDDPLTHGPTFG
jgi:hypothetical protein